MPHLGRFAQRLYVFQRTPCSVDVRENHPTDREWLASLEPGWQKRRTKNFDAIIAGGDPGVDVVADSGALADKVNSFITAYNNLVQFIDGQRTAANNGDSGSIGRDPLLRGLRNGLRTELLGAYGSASIQRLTEVGVEFTRDGTLQLNQAKFDEAVALNGDDVRTLPLPMTAIADAAKGTR